MAHRKGRSALTAAGVVLGVAIFFATLVQTASTQRGVDRLIEDFTGRADVVVDPRGTFGADLDAAVVDELRALPDVDAAVGSLGMPAVLATGDGRVELSLRGVDVDRARAVQDHDVESGRFPSGDQRAVAVPRRFATEHGLTVGGEIALTTPTGRVDVVVSGLLSDTGAGRTNEGRVAYTTIPTAEALSGKRGVVSGVALVLRDGVDVTSWIERHEDVLGDRATFADATTMAQGFKDFLGIVGSFFTFYATVTLFVGAFLIYLTLSTAVVERTRVYGTMRALGATRRQVATVVVTEALVLGALSTVAGLALGLLLAKGLLALVANLFDLELDGLVVTPGAVAVAAAVGLVTTTVSAVLPARRAGRLSPVTAMRGDHASRMRLGRGWIVGVVLVLTGAASQFGAPGLAGLGTLAVLLGAVLAVPVLLRPLASLLGRLTSRISRGVGDVAVLHLVKERSRSAYTLGLIMVVMAMLFAIGALRESVGATVDSLIERQFGSDLVVESGGTREDLSERLRGMRDVEAVTAIRFGTIGAVSPDGREHEQFVVVVDPRTYFDVAGYVWVDGSDARGRAALERGDLLMSDAAANTLDVDVGDDLVLRTGRGDRPFAVGATFVEIGGPPVVVLGVDRAAEVLTLTPPHQYAIALVDGADVDAAAAEISEELGSRFPIAVETGSEVRSEAQGTVGQFFDILYAILAVAAVVGVLGLANTLAMSVLQRYREIGILRAVGVTRSQVRRMVLVESATLGLVAFALALPLGWLLSTAVVRSTSDAFGFTIAYVFPAAWVPAIALFGVAVAVVAALAPARRAARLEVVGALHYE